MIRNIPPICPASDTDDIKREKRRHLIEHQIETLKRRSETMLPPDHPAQQGIERTLQKLYMEADAQD